MFINITIIGISLIGLFMYLIIVGGKMSLSEKDIERDNEAEIKWLAEIEEKRRIKNGRK